MKPELLRQLDRLAQVYQDQPNAFTRLKIDEQAVTVLQYVALPQFLEYIAYYKQKREAHG